MLLRAQSIVLELSEDVLVNGEVGPEVAIAVVGNARMLRMLLRKVRTPKGVPGAANLL